VVFIIEVHRTDILWICDEIQPEHLQSVHWQIACEQPEVVHHDSVFRLGGEDMLQFIGGLVQVAHVEVEADQGHGAVDLL